ncbi:hypothetical protein J2847_002592 [Azospirillum agricola]|nr:hypothetical protein [Azospirillum agricola]MBP2229298.1 hypothetical protein [Azospirillum agricola]
MTTACVTIAAATRMQELPDASAGLVLADLPCFSGAIRKAG